MTKQTTQKQRIEELKQLIKNKVNYYNEHPEYNFLDNELAGYIHAYSIITGIWYEDLCIEFNYHADIATRAKNSVKWIQR